MPLFDLPPKQTSRGLFGRDRELEELVRLVRARRWVAVLGPRMVGKTSLLRCASSRFGRPTLYVNLWGARGSVGLLSALVHGINEQRGLGRRIRAGLARIEGIRVGPVVLSLGKPARPLRTFYEIIDTMAREIGDGVIELDEVQEVAAASGTLHRLLANLFTEHPEISFVFSGSRFGLLRTLLEPEAESPMLGRPPAALQLSPFDPETSREFLVRGFAEFRLRFPKEQLDEVVARSLDGLPGWLALFGNKVAVERIPFPQAEAATLRGGRDVARAELAHFLEGREPLLHWEALRAAAGGGARWADLRDRLEVRRGGPVNDRSVQRAIRSLTDAGWLAAREGQYFVPDPMVRAVVLAQRNPPAARGPGTRRPAQ